MSDADMRLIFEAVNGLRDMVDDRLEQIRAEFTLHRVECRRDMCARLKTLEGWQATHNGRVQGAKEGRRDADRSIIAFVKASWRPLMIIAVVFYAMGMVRDATRPAIVELISVLVGK